jgi:hypothetical protein
MNNPLESDLKRHLAPVRAPEELWERVCERRAPRRRELYVPLWAAAVVLLSLGGGSLAAWRGTTREIQIKPASEYSSRTLLLQADRCKLCHTI